MVSYLGSIMKALLASAIAFVGALATAMVDDKSIGEITDGQWISAILAGLVALGAVYGVRNTPR